MQYKDYTSTEDRMGEKKGYGIITAITHASDTILGAIVLSLLAILFVAITVIL